MHDLMRDLPLYVTMTAQAYYDTETIDMSSRLICCNVRVVLEWKCRIFTVKT